jgi:signal transduction histidine kinase
MRSIRLSLTLYFLGLLALALGAASLLVYHIARRTLEDKRAATEALLRAQYSQREQAAKDELDKDLLSKAQTLARLTQFQVDRSQLRHPQLHAPVGLLSAGLAPNGYALVPAWAAQGYLPGPYGPFFWELRRQHTEIKLDTSDLLREVEGQAAEYFQIDGMWGSSYHSASLGNRSFPLDPMLFAPGQPVAPRTDDVWLDRDTLVRRVVIKASAGRLVWAAADSSPPRGSADAERDGRPPRPGPTIFVHCAYNAGKRADILDGLQAQRDGELADLGAATAQTQTGLLHRLLGLAAATFAAAVLGCYVLVPLGLGPLRRLSEAVSRVSPRDFRLPLDGARLPRELRPIAGRLTETLDQLERAFAREKQSTADLSHELRTPLAALLATVELALRKPREAEEYRDFLADCRQSARQMNEVVERLLTLARLDAGVEIVRPQAVDAAAVAEQVVAVVRPLAEARGVRLGLCVPADGAGCRIVADPAKLREVLTNLLHNAVQYNRPAGPDGGGTADVSVARDNGALVLEVRDTGIGIDPAAREHIFERFYRADPSRGHDGLHAGLGLAIVREYVGLMGGTVSVDSAPGRGSTFRVRLPLARGSGR